MASKRVNSYTYKQSIGEIPNGESLTVPDMTLTLEQLINRHARGQGITTFHPNWTTEEEIELGIDLHEIKKMDTFQKLEHAAKIKAQLETYRTTGEVPPPSTPEPTPEPPTEPVT